MSESLQEIFQNATSGGGNIEIVPRPIYNIDIYMDDGRVFSYNVESADKVREHAAAIISAGYRHSEEQTGIWEWYPPHRILKIKSKNIPTNYYTSNVRGT